AGYRYPATWYRYPRDKNHKLKGMSRLINQSFPPQCTSHVWTWLRPRTKHDLQGTKQAWEKLAKTMPLSRLGLASPSPK
ncbi:hypothetical protein PIB30_058754, partial [Stylosanthes scabra]|nr:hypothetical protein [Stylosanthes scabra]